MKTEGYDQRQKLIEREAGLEGAEFMQAPFHETEMETSLVLLKNGNFVLHRYIFGNDGDPTGVILKALTKAEAVRWWFEHFMPNDVKEALNSVFAGIK